MSISRGISRSMSNDIESHPTKGIFICSAGYFFVTLIGICEKNISSHVSIPVVLFFQNMICLLCLMPHIMRHGMTTLKTQAISTYVIRILSGLGCYAAFFYLIQFVPISEAFIYQYSASLWIPFIMLVWMNVRITRNLWSGIIIGFIGISLILKPTSTLFNAISLIGILCGVLQGISVVAIRKLSASESTSRILFYNFLVGTILSSCLLIRYWQPITLIDAFWLFGVGLSTYAGQKCITVSLRYAHAATLAPICYTSILFSGVIGWLLWDEIPDNMALLGMMFVILGCVLSLYVSKINSQSEKVLVYAK